MNVVGNTHMTTTLKMLAVRFDPMQTECMQERRQALKELINAYVEHHWQFDHR